MFDRFADDTRHAFHVARQEAERLGRREIDTEHILLGLAAGGSAVAARLWRRIGIEGARVRQVVDSLVTPGSTPAPRLGLVPFTAASKRVLEATVAEAKALGHEGITPIHLLLGLIAEEEGVAARALRTLGVEATLLRSAALGLEPTLTREATGDAKVRFDPRLDAFEPLSDRARASLVFACDEASSRARDHIDAEHVLLGLLRVGAGSGFDALKALGVGLSRVQVAVDRRVASRDPRFPLPEWLPLTPRAEAALKVARAEADRRGGTRLGTGYVLLGLVEDEDGIASQVLRDLDVDRVHVRSEVIARIALEVDD